MLALYLAALCWFFFNWSIVDLQYFRCTAEWFSFIYIYTHTYFRFFSDSFPVLDYYKILNIVPCAIQFSLVQSCPTLCDPVDCSMPGFPVHHQLVELARTHVHRVGDAIQPSYPLSSPSPAFSLSQHQGKVLYSRSLLSLSYVVVCICLSHFLPPPPFPFGNHTFF